MNKQRNTNSNLFVIQPNSDLNDDEDFGTDEKEQRANRIMQRLLEDKFRDLDNFLDKKMMRGLQDLAESARTRLDVIEKT